MTKGENSDLDENIFSQFLSAEELNNKRTSVRYIRADITASLQITGLFNSSKSYPIDLLDISSKGAAIKCSKSITVGKKIILKLFLANKPIFKLAAKIIYKDKDARLYGLKFDQFNNNLGDFLVSSTSSKLGFIFK